VVIICYLSIRLWNNESKLATASVSATEVLPAETPVVLTEVVTVTQTITVHDPYYGTEGSAFGWYVEYITEKLHWTVVSATDSSLIGGTCTRTGNGVCEPFITFITRPWPEDTKAYLIHAQWQGKQNGVGFVILEKTEEIGIVPDYDPFGYNLDQKAVAEAFGWEFPPINSTEGPASDKLFVLPLGWWPLNQSELILLKSDSNVDFDFSSRFSH